MSLGDRRGYSGSKKAAACSSWTEVREQQFTWVKPERLSCLPLGSERAPDTRGRRQHPVNEHSAGKLSLA